jgi:hypothetical protein
MEINVKSGSFHSMNVLNAEEMSMLYGGNVQQFFHDAGNFIGHCVGYAVGVVKDAVMAHGDDVVASGGAASVMAFK